MQILSIARHLIARFVERKRGAFVITANAAGLLSMVAIGRMAGFLPMQRME